MKAAQQIPSLTGLVLCGGRSTRMGVDKSELHYHNKTQRRYLYEMLSAQCEETFLSCNQQQAVHITNMPKIEDSFLNIGPLSGILSAFKKYPGNALLTVPCDLPFLDESTITYLIQHRNPAKMATCFWDTEAEFPEPLVVIWEPCANAVLNNYLKQGCSSPSRILINSDVEMLHAPDALVFKNVNTLAEHSEALFRLENIS